MTLLTREQPLSIDRMNMLAVGEIRRQAYMEFEERIAGPLRKVLGRYDDPRYLKIRFDQMSRSMPLLDGAGI